MPTIRRKAELRPAQRQRSGNARKQVRRRVDAADKTRAKIIDVAEALFAENGVDAVSLRTIIASAGVSLCLVNYHFGTKEGLLRAIFEKKVIPLNKERLRMIDVAEAAHAIPKLEDLLRAFFMPGLRAGIAKNGMPDNFDRLIGRIGSDPSEYARSMMREFFDDFQKRFIGVLRKSVPHLSAEDAYWRLHCLLGVVVYTATNPDRIFELSGGVCDIRNVDHAFDRMLPILVAAIGSPGHAAVGSP